MSTSTEPTRIEWADRIYWTVKPYTDRGETITYGEVAKLVGYPHPIHFWQFGSILAIVFLQDEAVAGSIVLASTGKPSGGFEWMQHAMKMPWVKEESA
jgi:alkylated DNA nucleotide flippase Atl1